MPLVDLSKLDEERIPDDTKAFNERIITAIEAGPELWDLPRDVVRQARREGKGIFPPEPFDSNAEAFEIDGKGGPITLRAIRPQTKAERGVFLHFHGGGWVYGNADMQDQRLKEIAEETGLCCVSVEYRLAPENPYPAGPDDCEDAALWLVNQGADKFETAFLAIGGESAGGHLAANALLRLRDRHSILPFHAAVLIAGAFDLGMTPSAANFKSNLILRHKDMVNFGNCFLQNQEDKRDPDVSPLYADLEGMPPAHFSVGTFDPLLDDSIFMANHWAKTQNDVELDVYAGGCHVFHYFEELEQARKSRSNINRFLNRIIEKQTSV
ncbi:MAG: alpha/beta hydrolase [Pseudomonadota bacterium]